MKKITELTEVRWRTVYHKDENGNRYSDTEEFEAYKQVISVSGWQRFGGFFIDIIIFQIIFYLFDKTFSYLIEMLNTSSIEFMIGWLSFTFSLLSYSTYFAFFEYKFQKTPAKFLMKTIVIDEYGNKPDLRTILLRSIIRLIPLDPFSFWWSNYGRGWHDSWSKTFVLTEDYLAELKNIQEEQTEKL